MAMSAMMESCGVLILFDFVLSLIEGLGNEKRTEEEEGEGGGGEKLSNCNRNFSFPP